MSTVEPIPMTITKIDDTTARVHGSVLDITLLQVISERSDRTALKHIRRVWGVDLPTARLLMAAGRTEEARRG